MLTPEQFAADNYLLGVPASNVPSGSIVYTTTEDERWDLISFKFYNNPFLYVGIILANPALPISGVVPSGTTLLIPFIQPPTNSTLPGPPWLTAGGA